MPILSPIGRKHPKVRALTGFIYLVLILGGVTMIYPFLLMISGSMKGATDIKHMDVVPQYFRSDEALYQRYVESLFNETLGQMRNAYPVESATFEQVRGPNEVREALVTEWETFKTSAVLSPHARMLGFVQARASRSVPQKMREFKKEMMRTYGGDIVAMNTALGTDFVNWNAFFIVSEPRANRLQGMAVSPFQNAFRAFANQQSSLYQVVLSLDGFYRTAYVQSQYTRDIAEYNRAHGTAYDSYDEVRLTRRAPMQGTDAERATWETFVRYTVNLPWVRVDADAAPIYRDFLRAKYVELATLNRQYATNYASFAAIPIPNEPPDEGLALSDWDAFMKGWKDPDTGTEYKPDIAQLSLRGPDFQFRDYLAEKHSTIEALNAALDTDFTAFNQIPMPQQEAHYFAFLDARRALRIEFATTNYRAVLDYLVFHGRGIMNTAIYCALAVLLALIVNPLAAYAMSRYKMPSAYKILLFLLLTMAFPPIVTQIPVFLTLRDLGLLNTFAALVLPGMANGYAIFLLKGFFDSLPRELYESAEMDGANEWVMFWTITMSLSKPILAVIALGAFTAAYSNFMFALLICQDERMWTLMVWLYQLQMRSGQAVMYASLLVAAVPTFFIFFFCQNIILRGIVVPVEK